MYNPLIIAHFDQRYLELVAQLEENEGELTPALEVELDELALKQVQSAEYYIKAMKHFDATEAAYDEIIDKFKKKKASISNEKDRWKRAMLMHQDNIETNVLECEIGKVRLMGTQKLSDNVFPEDLPEEFSNYEIKFSNVPLDELKEKLKEVGLDKHYITHTTSFKKKEATDTVKAEIKALPVEEQEQIKADMYDGKDFESKTVSGARLTVSKYVRIF